MVSTNSIKKRSRAQVSMEYLIVFAIAFAMTLPLIIIYGTQTNNIQSDITNAQIYKIASKISAYSEQVYYMGEPSQRTLYIEFPKGINNVNVIEHNISFNVTSGGITYVVLKETTANITGFIQSFEGPHKIIFKAESNIVTITDN
jgi:uncharacterized protein (UPF0333 family)